MGTEHDDIESMIASLEAKRDALTQAIDALRVVQGGSGGSSSPGGGGSTREIRSDTFWNKSIPDATKIFLGMSGKRPQKTDVIAEALQRGGLESKASNFTAVVQTILRRVEGQTGEFVRTPGGEWALPEWYGKTPRPRRGKDKDIADELIEGVLEEEKKPVAEAPVAAAPAKAATAS